MEDDSAGGGGTVIKADELAERCGCTWEGGREGGGRHNHRGGVEAEALESRDKCETGMYD
jgi:hypothetical protein